LQSLAAQTHQEFQVLFIDYGSTQDYAGAVEKVVKGFAFANYYYAGHQGLLWCKARALNYGIKRISTPWCFISDVDVLFHTEFVAQLYQQTLKTDSFYLADIAYLPNKYHLNNLSSYSFEARKPKHIHETFGVGLFPTVALQQVDGVDTFFHFYGSEDEDLNYRLEQAGFKRNKLEGLLLQHLWHERYPTNKDHLLTTTPRLKQVLRINQRHFLRRKEQAVTHYKRNLTFGSAYSQKDYERLMHHDQVIEVPNIFAHVMHALREELPACQNTIVRTVVYTDDYYLTFKYKLKRWLGKQSLAYMSLKTANDLILTEILFKYRDHNYSYRVHDDIGALEFVIEL
jgi:glycosyltransferase involved in cell wall biosynthesis